MEHEFLRLAFQQGGFFILLLLAGWFITQRALPRYLDEMGKISRALTAQRKASDDAHRAVLLLMVELSNRLQWHEATVSGLNIALGDVDERMTHARESFDRAQLGVAELRETIIKIYSNWDGLERRKGKR